MNDIAFFLASELPKLPGPKETDPKPKLPIWDIMNNQTAMNEAMLFIQIVGIIIPLIGIIVLLTLEQSKTVTYLILANISCFIVNIGYLLMLQSGRFDEGFLSLKIEFVGNILFYIFFSLFVFSYLDLKMSRVAIGIWTAIEGINLVLIWNDNYRKMSIGELIFEEHKRTGFHYIKIESAVPHLIRYGAISTMLLGMLIYTIYLFFKVKSKIVKKNFVTLASAQVIMIASLASSMFWQSGIDVMPICSSIAILMITLGILCGKFFSVTDRGRSWAFENIDDGFIVVDNAYGFLDANEYAKNLFPELKRMRKHVRIPDEVYRLFTDDLEEYELGDKFYRIMLTDIETKKEKEAGGYCLMMMDVTQPHCLLEELRVERDRAEAANEAKSAFVSNMSHEIRTPMNAIVGMTEILLRSEMKEPERGYLINIRNSGNSLLTIVNDILDFSKIESGKLEIIEDQYEPMSMLSDLSMIFLNRIGDKKIELLFDIDKELPSRLYGDGLRLRQIIINIMNNAIKFTEEGYVKLSMSVQEKNEDGIKLYFSIKDTGQGIREEDMDKLFGSFQQVDTKKNRNKEGTGLGLSISKSLIEAMGGEIGVRSTYGEGSEFYFTVIQKLTDEECAATLNKEVVKEPLVITACTEESCTLEEIKKLAQAYGQKFIDIEKAAKTKKVDYLFVDSKIYRKMKKERPELIKDTSRVCVLQNPMKDMMLEDEVLILNKPVFSLNFCQVLNHEILEYSMGQEEYINFAAPDANVLIVDDNEMNLKVAVGLLQPLKLQMDTADSGKKAIEMLESKKYDLIFMDHMMPVMDGIETTQKIRSMQDAYYQEVPIVALTANAVVGAKEEFMKAGMNDFVAKPIEMKEICAKIKKWLPKEKIQKQKVKIAFAEETDITDIAPMEGIDMKEGIKNSGSKELFLSLLSDFYKMIDMKSNKLEKCLADGMIRDYTIEVHALKNTARMIGAITLSESFYRMEQLGNAEDIDALKKETPPLLEAYRKYKEILRAYGTADNEAKHEATKEEISELLTKLNDAIDTFDLDGADYAMKKLEECKLPKELCSSMDELRAYVADVAMEEILQLTATMQQILEQQ